MLGYRSLDDLNATRDVCPSTRVKGCFRSATATKWNNAGWMPLCRCSH